MNTSLWIAQGILAGLFFLAGSFKAFAPAEKLRTSMKWTSRYQPGNIRMIAAAELLGTAGLILPWYLNLVPVLTPVAACALALVMMLATREHIKDKEYPMVGVNLMLAGGSAFVAWGRFTEICTA